MNADEIIFRCSSLKKLDTRGKAKDEIFGEVAKEEMRRAWIQQTANRFKILDNKFVSKGNKCEEDGLTLLSRIRKQVFNKNSIRLSNAFITGEVDTFIGKSITEADETFDTKMSWDIFSFYKSVDAKLNPDYLYQGEGYMALSGAKRHTVAYCLVNTPLDLVQKELYHESFNWEGNEAPTWVQLQAIANMVYDAETFEKYINAIGCCPGDDENAKAVYQGFVEIPLEKRIHEKSFLRDGALIESIYQRVRDCRDYMNKNFYN